MATAEETLRIQRAFLEECSESLIEGARLMGEASRKGGKILIIGNGGSAADAQHMAAELVGRMLIERPPVAAIALTTDTSCLTAVANDYSYDQIFVKQVQALARREDVLVAISTSGNSKNIVAAVEEARKIGCRVIALTGGSGGKLKELADVSLCASLGKNSSRIQESHIFAIHSLVDLRDRFFG
jgi:D-sedoheptulose 7-phosphate isomerase